VQPQALLQLRQLLLLSLLWMVVLHPLCCLESRAIQMLAQMIRCLQESQHRPRHLLLLLDCLLQQALARLAPQEVLQSLQANEVQLLVVLVRCLVAGLPLLGLMRPLLLAMQLQAQALLQPATPRPPWQPQRLQETNKHTKLGFITSTAQRSREEWYFSCRSSSCVKWMVPACVHSVPLTCILLAILRLLLLLLFPFEFFKL
jgi:hypothetical protein